ncbi:hypothetical protein [Oceanisphaera arctica]|uniref:Uncharacterized protein n=1 Tax=Oceanisphaera arctica TaxID=641510 RepID=A0A2P5TJW9_9GAMM|nr:hypothetical protein [Oceanisphaera arctica]PPL15379.1 hypothetical protein UN63_12770 [Oceanisphaera arctica]GHA28974.1 hypothetical protein GCM10007082_31350 [Oceanisphaera arctica]
MLSKLKERLFGKPPIERHHEFFGRIVFMGGDKAEPNDYWESEQPVSVLINAGLAGPGSPQVEFYRGCIADLDELFRQCWPIFEPDFELWTGKAFTGKWRDDFELMSIELPVDGDVSNDWSVCYFVDAANHYFTASFKRGLPRYNTIDG